MITWGESIVWNYYNYQFIFGLYNSYDDSVLLSAAGKYETDVHATNLLSEVYF